MVRLEPTISSQIIAEAIFTIATKKTMFSSALLGVGVE